MDEDIFKELIKENLKIIKKIGKGVYSRVYLAKHLETHVDYALKIIDCENSNVKKLVDREIEILRMINHTNIIDIFDVIYNKKYNNIIIILEYCVHGDLSYKLKNKRFSEKEGIRYIYQLISGLKYLNDNNIIHRDLKPQNILIDYYDNIKICDFGFSRKFNDSDVLQTLCGSPLYMAPEIIKHKSYNNKSDMWSFGIIVYQMLTGHLPYTANTVYELFKQINNLSIIYPQYLSYEIVELLGKIFIHDPDLRINFKDTFDIIEIIYLKYYHIEQSENIPIKNPSKISKSTTLIGLDINEIQHNLHNSILLDSTESLSSSKSPYQEKIKIKINYEPEIVSSNDIKSEFNLSGLIDDYFDDKSDETAFEDELDKNKEYEVVNIDNILGRNRNINYDNEYNYINTQSIYINNPNNPNNPNSDKPLSFDSVTYKNVYNMVYSSPTNYIYSRLNSIYDKSIDLFKSNSRFKSV